MEKEVGADDIHAASPTPPSREDPPVARPPRLEAEEEDDKAAPPWALEAEEEEEEICEEDNCMVRTPEEAEPEVAESFRR